MSVKVDQAAAFQTRPGIDSTSMASSPKISVIKKKAGFVIPKNKFSGSLVPLFKAGNKSETGDAVSEETNKQVQRNTKWAPDLTQDASVRRARALAYQTRVDQITQQLKLGSLSGDGQSLKPAGSVGDSHLSTPSVDYEKLQALELERREAIGEILKLNPGYKVPSDYEPVMREATVSVPVKEHPGCNFLSLLYGPDGDTHKRLEKETGSKIKVFGQKSEPKEKVEIAPSDSREVLISYDEVFVQILAESYEKVDAAASLIELLLSSVPGKSAAPNASTSASSGNAQVSNEVQDMAPVVALSSAVTGQKLVQPVMRPVSTSSQGSFQQYPAPWFPANQPNMPSGQASVTFTFNPSPMNPAFGPRPVTPYGFGSSPQSIQVGPPSRLHPPVQAFSLGQTGPPRNHPGSTSLSPFIGQQPNAAGPPRVPVPHFAERPLTPPASSPRWAVPPSGGPQSGSVGTLAPPIVSSQGPQSVASMAARPSAPLIHPQGFPQAGPTSVPSFASSQIRSSSAMPAQSFAQQPPQLNSSNNVVLRPGPPPSASFAPQSAMPSPALGASNTPSFTPLNPMGGATSRPPLQGPGDFTFQPHRPQGHPQSAPGHGVSFTSQRPPPAQLNSPQGASFRIPQHGRPNFSRPQMGPPAGQFGPLNPRPNIGPRNLSVGPPMTNPGGSFPGRVGHSGQFQQSYNPRALGRPGGFIVGNQHPNASGRPQVYDPFSPTSVSDKGSNIPGGNKQQCDPEYEDLMASVGVK